MNSEPGTSMNVAVIGMAGRFPGAQNMERSCHSMVFLPKVIRLAELILKNI
jgi:hypothetical protein